MLARSRNRNWHVPFSHEWYKYEQQQHETILHFINEHPLLKRMKTNNLTGLSGTPVVAQDMKGVSLITGGRVSKNSQGIDLIAITWQTAQLIR